MLRAVPFRDQAVAEGERGSSIGGRLVTIENTAGERGLDVAYDIALEVLDIGEGLRGELLPCCALRFGDGCCEMRMLAIANSSCSGLKRSIQLARSLYFNVLFQGSNLTLSSPRLPHPPLNLKIERLRQAKKTQTFHTLNLSCPQSGHSTLMLRPRQPGRSHRALQVGDRSAGRGASLPWGRGIGHLVCCYVLRLVFRQGWDLVI